MIKQTYYHSALNSFKFRGGKVNLFFKPDGDIHLMIGHLMRYGSLGEFEIITKHFHN